MKIFKRIILPAIGTLALAAVFIIALSGCSTKSTASADSPKPVPYPFNYCVVSGDKLGGDMGPPIEFIYSANGVNQEIKFCCLDCKPTFLKNPDKYMKIIRDAEAAQNNNNKN